MFACGISCAGGSSWLDRPGEGPEDSDCTVRGKNLSKLITSCYFLQKMMEKVRFGVKELWCRKSREATENLNRQKSLGVYHDFACQAIASTTKNSEINATFVWGARQGQTRKQDKRQTRPKKKQKKQKRNPSFWKNVSIWFLTTLMKCPPNYTNQIIIQPQCGFF